MNSNACTVCDKSNASFCNRCKNSRYCSKACQKADWATHKLLCEAFSKFDRSSRPSEEHFCAILFPVDRAKPEFVWLPSRWKHYEDNSRYQVPEIEPLLGPDAPQAHPRIQYNPILKRKLYDTIITCHRDTFLFDGSKPNTSIATITATKSGKFHDWRGPIVAYGMWGLGIDPHRCKDLDMEDFRHITDYFLSYDYKPADKVVKGVRINCEGDQKIYKKPPFEAIDLTSTDPIFSDHDTSDIADRIGLSIFTRRLPPDPKWAKDESNKMFKGSPSVNQDATFLHLCLDPKADYNSLTERVKGWGWAPSKWQDPAGSVIVVRQDKKPLDPFHLEAMCRYCRYDVRPLLAHSIGEYAPDEPLESDAVLAMICRPTFSISWYKSLERVRKEEGRNLSSTFPYRV